MQTIFFHPISFIYIGKIFKAKTLLNDMTKKYKTINVLFVRGLTMYKNLYR
jgi:hypothetical protein